MVSVIAKGLLIPFLGTALGSACVLFMKKDLSPKLQRSLSGFAAGVMIAASVWSLLIPSMDQATEQGLGKLGFIPAVIGFCLGMLFLLFLDVITPHMHLNETVEGPKSKFSKSTMMVLAVTLHNIPEGMAVGVLYAGWYTGAVQVSASAALALAIGIAIQNFPEGSAVSIPLFSEGVSKTKSFLLGSLSGIVEPLFGILAIFLAQFLTGATPFLLSFAAGAMIYVTIDELIPEFKNSNFDHYGLWAFVIGFSIMMLLEMVI